MTWERENISAYGFPPANKFMEYVPVRESKDRGSSLVDEAYEYILKHIVFPTETESTAVRYGGKITESKIAKELRMSNGPVRSALSRLHYEGWVHAIGFRGSFLVDFSDPAIALEIYQFRVNLEAGAFFTLAANITDDQLFILEQIVKKMEDAAQTMNVNDFRQQDTNFHLAVIEMAGGRYFKDVYRPKLLQWFAMAFQVHAKSVNSQPSLSKESIESFSEPTHRELYEALARRDSSQAAHLIMKHFNYVAKLINLNQQDAIPVRTM